MEGPPVLVLASASPRRRALLEQVGLEFKVAAPAVDETPPAGAEPTAVVLELARRKAEAARRGPHDFVLAADTEVFLDAGPVGKPKDPNDASRILRLLSARPHRVLTGVVVLPPSGAPLTDVVSTQVWFARLEPRQIEAYVATGEPLDKAGAYGAQGRGAAFIERIDGDFSNVVGLPLRATVALLERARYPLPAHLRAS